MVLGDFTLHRKRNEQLLQSGGKRQSCGLPLGQTQGCGPRISPRERGLWRLRTELLLPWLHGGGEPEETNPGHQANRDLHERRWPRHRSGLELVELRLPVSTLHPALGHYPGAAVRPSWQRWQLFLGGWPHLHDLVESHVQGRKREYRLVLPENSR